MGEKEKQILGGKNKMYKGIDNKQQYTYYSKWKFFRDSWTWIID